MSLIKNRLFILGVLVVVSATAAVVVLGKQEVVEKNISVKVVNFTKTYQEFQNAPEVNGQRKVELFIFPEGAEVLRVWTWIGETWETTASNLPTLAVNTSNGADDCFDSGGGPSLKDFPAGFGQPVTGEAFCGPDSPVIVSLIGDTAAIDAITKGSLEFAATYIVHGK